MRSRVVVGALVLVSAVRVVAADKGPGPYDANIQRGRAYLFKTLENEGRLGYLALGTMALLKTGPEIKEQSAKDPRTSAFMKKIREKIDADPIGEMGDQFSNYTFAVCISAMIADTPSDEHDKAIRKLVRILIDRQIDKGGWAYPGDTKQGDTSQTQYAILALWDAAQYGVDVPLSVWDKALNWHIERQDAAGKAGPGGFSYHPTDPKDGKLVDQSGESCPMSVAGLGSMLICQSQIPHLKKKSARHMDIDELIRPVKDEGEKENYKPIVTPEAAQKAIAMAENWVTKVNAFNGEFKTEGKINYYLYGYERAAALRRGGKFKESDWYGYGGGFLSKDQKQDGSWAHEYAGAADTSFAILFLGRTMAKKIQKVDVSQLARSTAVSGRGLPTSDGSSSALERQIEKYKTPTSTDIDSLLKMLDDSDADIAEEVAAQVNVLKPEELKALIQKLGNDGRKLRQWANDKRPEARKAAITALSRTRDLRFVPMLIEALKDKDDGVYAAARDGLRYVSRQAEVFGLPVETKRDAGKEGDATKKLWAWYHDLKVQPPAYQEFTPPNP
jgi:hypothetical protein